MSRIAELNSQNSLKRFYGYLKNDLSDNNVKDLLKNRRNPEKCKDIITNASREPTVTRFLMDEYPEFSEALTEEILANNRHVEEKEAEESMGIRRGYSREIKEERKFETPKRQIKQKSKSGREYQRGYQKWTPKQEIYIKNYKGNNIEKDFSGKFGISRSKSSINSKRRRMK